MEQQEALPTPAALFGAISEVLIWSKRERDYGRNGLAA